MSQLFGDFALDTISSLFMMLFLSQSIKVTCRAIFLNEGSPYLKDSNQNYPKTSVDVTAIKMVIGFSYQASDVKKLLVDFRSIAYPAI